MFDNLTILRHVRDDLLNYAATNSVHAYVSIASTHRRAIELLAAPPNGLFIVLTWDGEEDVSQSALSGIVEQSFSVYVSQQSDLNVTPGADVLDQSAGGGPGLLQSSNAIRDRIRGLLHPDGDTDIWFWYRGQQQVVDSNQAPLNVFRLKFTLHNALPQPAYHQPRVLQAAA